MRYALWQLKQEEPNYLSGPESQIYNSGGSAEASWTDGQPSDGASILGYVTGEFDVAELSSWLYTEISQAEALAFCQKINADAFVMADGKIASPLETKEN